MRHITRCVNPRLADLCQRAIKLEELSEKIYTYLPEALRDQCHVGSFNNSCLILIVTDPIWATQLRYTIPELRDRLRSEAGIHQLASIKIALNTDLPSETTTKEKSPTRKLTTTVRDHLGMLKDIVGPRPNLR